MERVHSEKIFSSKFEHNDPIIRNWFKNFIDMLEQHASIESWKRTSVLKEIFPTGVLQQVISIMTVLRDNCDETDTESPYTLRSSETSSTLYRTDQRTFEVSKSDSGALFTADKKASEDLFDYITTPEPNPYINFFKKPEILASIWRPSPPIVLEHMSLQEKTEAISERIAAQFVEFVNDNILLEGTLKINSIIDIFSITDIVIVPLKVNIQELYSVPKNVGVPLNLLERTKKEVLKREIDKDVRATEVKLRTHGFGRMMPGGEQSRPLNKRNVLPWLKCTGVPAGLESMQRVWDGITNLKSTHAFCDFLVRNHPKVKPPQYLKDCGLLDEDAIKSISARQLSLNKSS